jgi:hypothetical protein
MNIAQLSEQLKDVPQGTLVGYAKNPNSVVPQFLALAEIQRRQSLQAQAPAPTGTVADDVLAQAAPPQVAPPQMAPQQVDPRLLQAQAMQQQAMQQQVQQLPENQPGVAQLPSGMPQGMAAGGIVAFAEGGLNPDDDEDDREMAQLFPKQSSSRFDQFQELLATLPSTVAGGIRGLADKGATKYKEVMSGVPSSLGGMRKDISNAASDATDNIEEFLSKIKHLESRGRSFDSKGNILTSQKGAQGSMQVMPKTQVNPGFGVTPARDKSPEELERVGREYGIAMLNEFKDPKLAAMAYNWGPANVKKWLASDRSTPIPKETSKYASNFAEGGSVKGYSGKDGESDVNEDNEYLNRSRSVVNAVKSAYDAFTTPKNYDLYDMYQRNIGQPFARGVDRFVNEPLGSQANKFRSYSMTPDKEPTVGYRIPAGTNSPAPSSTTMTRAEADRLANISAATHAQRKEGLDYSKAIPNKAIPQYGAMPSDEELKNMDIGFGSGKFAPSAGAPAPSEPTTAPKTKADLYAEALEQDIKSQAAKAAKEGNMTLAMSILQAGLGMMASKSPYALGGIGEGGQQGVATFATLKKQEADRAKDLMAARLGLYKYGAASESAAATRALDKEYKDLTLAQRERIAELDRGVKTSDAAERAEERAFLRYGTRVKEIEEAVRKPYLANPMYALNPEKFAAEIQAKIDQAKLSDDLLNALRPRAGLGASVKAPSGPVIVQTPKGAVSFPNQAAADEFKLRAGIK